MNLSNIYKPVFFSDTDFKISRIVSRYKICLKYELKAPKSKIF